MVKYLAIFIIINLSLCVLTNLYNRRQLDMGAEQLGGYMGQALFYVVVIVLIILFVVKKAKKKK